MRILGIETSCDETAAAIVESTNPIGQYDKKTTNKKIIILSSVVATSLELHAKTGGIIPESAAREQIKYIIPVIQKCLRDARMSEKNIDALAVTIGPGLIGSLLVGVETAKTLAFTWNKPLIPVNHLIGHIYANFISDAKKQTHPIVFPAVALLVSGNHTDLLLLKTHATLQWLDGTRDDAAGEAFDKIGRILSMPYPAGPVIENASKQGDPKSFLFPRPLIHSNDYSFSFSGLKTAVYREVEKLKQKQKNIDQKTIFDIAASAQQAIVDVLTTKTLRAVKQYNVKSLLLGGGVAANQKLKETIERSIKIEGLQTKLFVPKKNLCTDNAAMIAAAAFYHGQPESWKNITADPELYFN